MQLLLGLFVGLLLVYLLAYTDFVLSRKLKERVTEINAHGERFYRFRPLNIARVAVLSLLFWLIPIFLISPQWYLEYRLGLTILVWALLAAGAYCYLYLRTSPRTARQALPLLLGFAVAAGLLLGPLFSTLRRLLPGFH